MKKKARFLGTNSSPLGSIWEIGLTAEYVYRMCRIYLRPQDKEPGGLIIYVDEKSQSEYMVQAGRKVYFKAGDDKPDATYVYLGKRGGRYLVSEEKITELIHNPKKYFHRAKPKYGPRN